jgi:hypothetical protein
VLNFTEDGHTKDMSTSELMSIFRHGRPLANALSKSPPLNLSTGVPP